MTDVVRRLLPERPSRDGGRLGRHVHHDPSSWAYRVVRTAASLRSVRHRRHVPVYDQGDLGSCVAHAGKGVLCTGPFTRHFVSERSLVATYSELTATDDVPGQYPPDDTGSDGLSFAKLAVRHQWISRYDHAMGIDDTLSALQQRPVMAGTDWREGQDRPDSTGLVHPTGGVRGGHEYVLDELLIRGTVPDIHEDRIGATNSWSANWGVGGRFYFLVAEFADLLDAQGDVTVLVR